MSRLPLRPYQEDCVGDILTELSSGVTRTSAILPTGAGKTVIFSTLSDRALEMPSIAKGKRVLILAHTDELVTQAAAKFRMVDPDGKWSVGIVKAQRNEFHRDVVVASIQTLRSKKRRERIKSVGLIIVDEAHHVMAKTYKTILTHFGAFGALPCEECDGRGYIPTPDSAFGAPCPAKCDDGKIGAETGVKVVGFTATMVRADNASLGEVWETVAYKQDIAFMISNGYLKGIAGKRVEVPDFDLSKVKKIGGDYAEGALGEALTSSLAPEIVAKAYVEHASDRSGVMFTPTVASAYTMSEAMQDVGLKSEVVHGGLQPEVRRDILARFDRGEIQVVANAMVLTEGWDSPIASCAVLARPTKSAGLYQQQVGRVLRPYPGIDRALILDVVGVSHRHDLATLVQLVGEDMVERSPLDPDEVEDCEDGDCDEDSGIFPDEVHRGPVIVRDFDPLVKASKWVWSATAGGTMFLSAGTERYVFLAPSETPGLVDVAWCTRSAYKRSGGFTDHRQVELGYAVAWAENVANEMSVTMGLEEGEEDPFAGNSLARKSAAWRKRKPTDKAVAYARSLGITVLETDRGGDVAVKIDVVNATRRIDPIVRAMIAQNAAKLVSA